jgi:hypothetical protein
MDVLPGVWSLSPLAALTGIIVLVGWLIYTGRLIPKASHERELTQQKEFTVREQVRGDEWKATALAQEEVNKEIRSQNSQLVQSNEITAYFFRSIAPSLGDTLDPKGRS